MANQYPIRILTQLNPVLQGFRRSRGLTQADIAARLGVSQQSYARLEANPGRASVARVLAVLQALEVDLVLAPRGLGDATAAPAAPDPGNARPGTAGAPPKVPPKTPSKTPSKAPRTAARRKPKPDPGPGEDW